MCSGNSACADMYLLKWLSVSTSSLSPLLLPVGSVFLLTPVFLSSAIWMDGSLFNIRRLTAETKVSHNIDRVFELQYADDAALPAHSATTLQGSLDVLSSAYSRTGLNVSAKKTEVLSLTANRDSHAAAFSVHGNRLVEARECTYLGSILSADCSVNSEIEA